MKVSALFKLGGYRSYKNYISRIKDLHITSGFLWHSGLDLIVRSGGSREHIAPNRLIC